MRAQLVLFPRRQRFHSHICSVAYPVLEAAGELEPSRLRQVESTAVNLLAGAAASEPSF
jgi:phosphate:Na+ symporter